ncbi:hypothetical protein [Mycobacterium sp. DL440]|uniref:hypothetical protein n=1 Tax=Mycobacterium sp. DL440 TaxID=2675523 RepID=UPI0014242DE6|nr:hypothetical protein [Mycobacterium sp. DL440]
MSTGILYRAAQRNEHDDPVDADGNLVRVGSDGTEVGEINGLVMGGPSWRPINDRGDIVNTTGMVGVPVTEPNEPRHGDLLVIDGVRFKIQGLPQWQTRGLVATPPRFDWWTITSTAN